MLPTCKVGGDQEEQEEDFVRHVVLPPEQKVYPSNVDLLIAHALKIPPHPTVAQAFIFRDLAVKTVTVFGTVIGRRTFGTMQSYYLSDDTGAIWVNVNQKVHSLSQCKEHSTQLNSHLEIQECLVSDDPEGIITHNVLKSLMKEVNKIVCKSSEPFPLGTVLRVTGWLVDNHQLRKVTAFHLTVIDDPHIEAELMMYLASLYSKLYVTK